MDLDDFWSLAYWYCHMAWYLKELALETPFGPGE
jgi:hypothetical protein